MLIFLDKNLFFQGDLKKSTFSFDFDIFLEMFIFADIGKKRFLKVISKKRPFSRNVDIFGYMNKKRYFQF